TVATEVRMGPKEKRYATMVGPQMIEALAQYVMMKASTVTSDGVIVFLKTRIIISELRVCVMDQRKTGLESTAARKERAQAARTVRAKERAWVWISLRYSDGFSNR